MHDNNNGYAGKILWVDLADRSFREEETDNYREWIGGRGLGLALLARLPDLAADDPAKQPIAITSGLLSGSAIPMSSRAAVTGRNQLSNGIYYSNVGGDFGLRMKTAGYDAVVLRNASSSPVYLLLGENGPELKSADSLWGLRISEMRERLTQTYPDRPFSFIGIGPAGENLVRISCLMVDRAHAAGWGGGGLVFGSKQLKAVVACGYKKVVFKYPAELTQKAHQLDANIGASPAMQVLKRGGTHASAAAGGFSGKVPTAVKNMRNEFLSPEESKPIQEAAARQWEIKRAGCPGCNLQCLHVYRLPTAAQGELEIEGMHANSVRGLGSNLGVDDIEAILRMHWLVNEYGMDVDGVSSSMAFALECAENELLPVEQPGGVRLEWGDAASLVRLTEQIARREGFGALLGEGAYRAAQQVGPESMEYAMTTKKVGINEQGIRSHRGWALGIMTSTRGGGHLGGAVQSENRQISAEEGARLFDNPLAGNPQAYEGKGRMVAYSEGLKAIIDSLGLCYFAYGWYDREIANMNDLADLYFAASGHHISGEDLHHQGLRVHTLERYLTHVFGGFDRRDDMVPKRFFEMPNADGPYEGAKLDREAVQQQLDEYYAFLGWNSSSGLPDADAIHSYDLDNWVIFD